MPLEVAVNVTFVEDSTLFVLTTNLAEVCPAGTMTVAGTVAVELPLFNETVKPPTGAGESKVTTPVEVAPPLTVVGETANDNKVGGKIVNALLTDTPPAFAVMVALV